MAALPSYALEDPARPPVRIWAQDSSGARGLLPPAVVYQPEGLCWPSRGDLMVWDPHRLVVERWRATDDGWRRVEVWSVAA